MKEIQIIEFTSINRKLIEQIKPILESAFKKAEEASWNGFMKEFEDYNVEEREKAHLFGAISEKNLLGFGISKFLKEFTYVPYLAVAKNIRNRGIGTQLAEKILAIARNDAKEFKISDSVLFAEVDIPELAPTREEKLVREQRIRLFQTYGSIILDIDYNEPHNREGKPSYLLMIPLSNKDYIESKRLLRYVGIIYREEAEISMEMNVKYLKNLKNSIKKRKRIYGKPNFTK